MTLFAVISARKNLKFYKVSIPQMSLEKIWLLHKQLLGGENIGE